MKIDDQKRTLQPLGGSLAITLPYIWCRHHNLEKGSALTLKIRENSILIVPIGEENEE